MTKEESARQRQHNIYELRQPNKPRIICHKGYGHTLCTCLMLYWHILFTLSCIAKACSVQCVLYHYMLYCCCLCSVGKVVLNSPINMAHTFIAALYVLLRKILYQNPYSPTSIIQTSIIRTPLLTEHIVLAMHKFIYS